MYSIESQLSKNPNILLSELYLIYTIFISRKYKKFSLYEITIWYRISEYREYQSSFNSD